MVPPLATRKAGAVLIAALLLTGCGGAFQTAYTDPPLAGKAWRVTDVTVVVVAGATTTEADLLAPNADIVWHSEPYGDRKTQVAAIVAEGLRRGARGAKGPRPVTLSAEIQRFHGVTPAALNQSPSAVHDIEYLLEVRDAASGALLAGPVHFETDLQAYTQTAAAVAAQDGQTPRKRIVAHIARVTAHWLGLSGDDPRGSFMSIGR